MRSRYPLITNDWETLHEPHRGWHWTLDARNGRVPDTMFLCGGATLTFSAEMSWGWLACGLDELLGYEPKQLGHVPLSHFTLSYVSYRLIGTSRDTSRARKEGETCLVFSALGYVCVGCIAH